MQFGYKMDKKIAPLEIGYRKYEFAYFTEGRSDKNVFGIFTPEGKKFVLKMLVHILYLMEPQLQLTLRNVHQLMMKINLHMLDFKQVIWLK